MKKLIFVVFLFSLLAGNVFADSAAKGVEHDSFGIGIVFYGGYGYSVLVLGVQKGNIIL